MNKDFTEDRLKRVSLLIAAKNVALQLEHKGIDYGLQRNLAEMERVVREHKRLLDLIKSGEVGDFGELSQSQIAFIPELLLATAKQIDADLRGFEHMTNGYHNQYVFESMDEVDISTITFMNIIAKRKKREKHAADRTRSASEA